MWTCPVCTCLDCTVDERWGQSPIWEDRKKDQLVCFAFNFVLFCFVCGEGGVGWRSCVLFGRKFKASGDFWAEMLGKTVGIYKKLRGEVQAEEKQLGGNRLFAASY